MQPFDIFYAEIDMNGCTDPRPVLLVRPMPFGAYDCFPIAEQCYQGGCFYVDSSHPDFAATGLKKSSNIHDARFYTIEADEFRGYRGALTNQLLADFKGHAGL